MTKESSKKEIEEILSSLDKEINFSDVNKFDIFILQDNFETNADDLSATRERQLVEALTFMNNFMKFCNAKCSNEKAGLKKNTFVPYSFEN